MKRYQVGAVLGDGTYGTVLRGVNKTSGEVVALKKMKRNFYSWDECVSLREVKALKKLSHPNIVKLKEVVRERNELFFIFEFMDSNLYELLKQNKRPLEDKKARSVMRQLFKGLAFMHQNGYFHRDIKPENLLCKGEVVKIADFGLAREVRSLPPYTEYVSTRWYRAPELLLHSTAYNSPVDVWACGCILAELLMFVPLFPGKTEVDQLLKVCSILGTPEENSSKKGWKEGFILAKKMGFQWPSFRRINLKDVLREKNSEVSSKAIDLLDDILVYDPQQRPSAGELLQSPYLAYAPYKEVSDIELVVSNTRSTRDRASDNLNKAYSGLQSSRVEDQRFQSTFNTSELGRETSNNIFSKKYYQGSNETGIGMPAVEGDQVGNKRSVEDLLDSFTPLAASYTERESFARSLDNRQRGRATGFSDISVSKKRSFSALNGVPSATAFGEDGASQRMGAFLNRGNSILDSSSETFSALESKQERSSKGLAFSFIGGKSDKKLKGTNSGNSEYQQRNGSKTSIFPRLSFSSLHHTSPGQETCLGTATTVQSYGTQPTLNILGSSLSPGETGRQGVYEHGQFRNARDSRNYSPSYTSDEPVYQRRQGQFANTINSDAKQGRSLFPSKVSNFYSNVGGKISLGFGNRRSKQAMEPDKNLNSKKPPWPGFFRFQRG